jgi:hypothetical protein
MPESVRSRSEITEALRKRAVTSLFQVQNADSMSPALKELFLSLLPSASVMEAALQLIQRPQNIPFLVEKRDKGELILFKGKEYDPKKLIESHIRSNQTSTCNTTALSNTNSYSSLQLDIDFDQKI